MDIQNSRDFAYMPNQNPKPADNNKHGNQFNVFSVFSSFCPDFYVLVSWKLEPLHISKIRDTLGFIMFVDSFPLDSSSFIIYVSLRDIIVSYAIRYTN